VYKGFGTHYKKPVIYIANHQSSLDIPLIGSAIGQFPLIWLARSELEESFLLKIVLRCCAVVTQVGNAKNSALSLRKLFVLLKDSPVCPVIFPEGSRYDDGLVHEFFNGFAFLARETQRSVVPILIENACTVYPRGVFFVNRKPVIVITQGPEFFIGSDETIDAFSMRVKAWFLEKNGTSY
jgi:1-acyl-sn-glycerol-3-phosphate acyltransferase